MINDKPLVSIGMPVYNGERYIRQALDSLLAQDYENFELIISDNASMDDTWEICREYAAKDSRIKVYSNERNLGAMTNFRIVLNIARGPYFMWAAADDLWKPVFISELVGLLETTPSAVLAMCRVKKIDSNGLSCGLGPVYLSTTGMTRAERLRYSAQRASGWIFYGLYRTETARAALPIWDERLVMGAGDVLFLRKCIDSGDLVFSEKVLFLKRQGGASFDAGPVFTSLTEMWRILFWHCYVAFFRCYCLDDLSPREAALVYVAIVQGLRKRHFYKRSRRTVQGIGASLLRKVASALTGALAYRSK